jgi:hypothetical protein
VSDVDESIDYVIHGIYLELIPHFVGRRNADRMTGNLPLPTRWGGESRPPHFVGRRARLRGSLSAGSWPPGRECPAPAC